MKNINDHDRKNRILKELEEDIRCVKKNVKCSRGIKESPRLKAVREHLNLALETNLECSVDKRIETLVGSLMNARDEIDKSKKEFHSKEMKELREDIEAILKKYESEI